MSSVRVPRRTPSGSLRRRRVGGVAVVELAIVLPLFILLMLAILDFSRMMFTQITLQHAIREGGRFGVTGQRRADPAHPQTLQSRLESIKAVVRESAVGVDVDPNDIVVASVLGGEDNAGGPGDTFTISLTYRFGFATPLLGNFFDDGAYTFTVSTSFRNEPFPPGSSL